MFSWIVGTVKQDYLSITETKISAGLGVAVVLIIKIIAQSMVDPIQLLLGFAVVTLALNFAASKFYLACEELEDINFTANKFLCFLWGAVVCMLLVLLVSLIRI